jgi:adenosylhomocysteine nucleosidase
MPGAPKVVIVAALEREVPFPVKHWRRVERQHDGRRYRFFEGPWAALVCGGIGAEFARRATEAAIALYQPVLVISAGFAGGLAPELKAGDTIFPSVVVDAQDGSRAETVICDTAVGQREIRQGVLVSVAYVAGQEQKQRLAAAYGAKAVDMEAAAVARGAEARGIAFIAVKAISDEAGHALPPTQRFVTTEGKFSTWRFVAYVAPRFWLWLPVARLARNSRLAAKNLSLWLGNDVLWTSMTLRAFANNSGIPEMRKNESETRPQASELLKS